MISIEKYTLLSADTAILLAEGINAGIQNGWQPFGSPCMSITSGTRLGESLKYCQAMVQYEKTYHSLGGE
jgi:hypothetical protein